MRVLFVGNSHTYFNDMPRTFAVLWEEALGERPEVTMLAYSNRTLQWHSDEYFALRFNLLYGGFDCCVIQQSAHPFPGYEATKQGIGTILRLCRESGTKPFLYMPWAEKRFPENQEKITSALGRIAAEAGCTPVPVGDVWETIRREHPDIELFWRDGEHASVAGDYLIAAVMCMVISGRGDLMLSRRAHDFTHGADIDFDHPAVAERGTACEIDPTIAGIILETAKRVLYGGQ